MDAHDTEELEIIRTEVGTSLRRNAYFYLVMIATVLLAAGSSILVTVKLTERSERKLCAVVINADEGYRHAPPSQPAGIEQAKNIHALRGKLGCPSEGEQ